MHMGGRRRDCLDETALVESMAARPDAALEAAYARHGAAVFGLARRVLLDHALAEEITQEVFYRLWNSPTRFDHTRGSLRSFLLADCHGRAIDLIRAETSRRNREGRDHVLDLREFDDPEALDGLADTDAVDRIQEALRVLPTGELEAVSLAYFGGFTYREVAVRLQLPEGTVKSRIRRGLERLRAELGGTAVDDERPAAPSMRVASGTLVD